MTFLAETMSVVNAKTSLELYHFISFRLGGRAAKKEILKIELRPFRRNVSRGFTRKDTPPSHAMPPILSIEATCAPTR